MFQLICGQILFIGLLLRARDMYVPCRCEASTTPVYVVTSYTPTVVFGDWQPDAVSEGGGTSVEVISFAVGGLMGLAFAVASVYKW